MKVNVGKNSVVINGREVSFEEEIFQTLQFPDRFIVLLNPADIAKDDPLKGRNIICLDEKGELLWRIQDSGIPQPMMEGGKEIPEPYTGLELDEDGKTVKVFVPIGIEYDLDPETGEISNPVFTK